MSWRAYYITKTNCIIITKGEINDAIFLCSGKRSIARIHWSMLKQFKLTDGSYMMSDQLLILISKIFNKHYDDLWNVLYFRDQIDLNKSRTLVVRPKRTDEGWLSDLGILGDQEI